MVGAVVHSVGPGVALCPWTEPPRPGPHTRSPPCLWPPASQQPSWPLPGASGLLPQSQGMRESRVVGTAVVGLGCPLPQRPQLWPSSLPAQTDPPQSHLHEGSWPQTLNPHPFPARPGIGFPRDMGLCEEWVETRIKSRFCRKEEGRVGGGKTREPATQTPAPHPEVQGRAPAPPPSHCLRGEGRGSLRAGGSKSTWSWPKTPAGGRATSMVSAGK